MNKKTITVKQVVLVGLMAALTAVGSALRITLPLDIGGNTSFHLGNIFCALCGILLGPWLGGVAAGLGSAVYDMTNPLFLPECWLTFLMKGAYGLAAGLVIRAGGRQWGVVKSVLAAISGAVTYALLYLLKSYLKAILVTGLDANAAWLAVVGKLPATAFNAGVAILFAPVLALAISKALGKNHLSLE